jgi:tRNA dimethylallyltransferase
VKDRALVVLGPTATGKTSLALELAKIRRIEVISLDSALVYRGMDIGTAKPTPEERSVCPHHLIDIRDPAESYSAADFRADCARLVPEICARGALPVICGGTMMYYKALCEGLSPLPKTDPEVRARVAAEAAEKGWPAMHEKLRGIDPPLYRRLAPNDRQRVSRALEVYEMSGRPLSSFYAQKGEGCPFMRAEIVLLPGSGREELRVKIRQRFMKMLDDGLIGEVAALRGRGDLNLSMPSMRAVGYRQVWEHLDGALDYQQMIERSVIATARLAKHQMTWLRGGLSSDGCLSRVVKSPSDPGCAQAAAALADALDAAANAEKCG